MKLKRVRLEYDDGRIIEFKGDEAEEWQTAVDNACVIADMHGMNTLLNDFWKKRQHHGDLNAETS